LEQDIAFELSVDNINDGYQFVVNTLTEEILKDISLRFSQIKVTDGETCVLYKANHLLTAIMFLRPFSYFDCKIDIDAINEIYQYLSDSNASSEETAELFNYLIEIFDDFDKVELNDQISAIIRDISDLGARFNSLYGNTITIQDHIDLADKNPEYDELLNFTIPNGLQFSEIEDIIKIKVDRAVEILAADDSPLANLLNSGSAINVKQFGQSVINVGLKPDLFGKIIPQPINTSLLRGFTCPRDFYINAIGARKALITNHKQVRNAGYLARKLALMIFETDVSDEYTECDTHHGVTITVNSEKMAERLIGRWTLAGELVTRTNYKDFVDHTWTFRDPTTCAGEHKVCSKCYGELYRVNQSLHAGLIAILLLSERIVQNLLSTKHLLQTNTDRIEFCDIFDQGFIVDKANILANISLDKVIINIDDVQEDEITGNRFIEDFKISIRSRTHEVHSPVRLFLTKPMLDKVENITFGEANVDPNTIEGAIFHLIIDNNELSASLYKILNLIEKDYHLGCEDYHQMIQNFLELLDESNIPLHSTHVGMIIRALVWDDGNPSIRPNFLSANPPGYRIKKVQDVIFDLPLSISLVFEKIKDQFKNFKTFDKDKKAILDGLFIK